ncbi:MAG TPA: helix-turn-helix domain-containing protein [Polyangiaceae bacterium]|jgi:excisionase family DNA binding protein
MTPTSTPASPAFTLTVKELGDLIEQKVREALAVHAATETMTRTQVAKMLGLHPKSVSRLVARRELPAKRIGRTWRFEATKVKEWMGRGANAR